MEPGLRGREDVCQVVAVICARTAAMEPGLRGREDPFVSAVDPDAVQPLWSPAFGAGKTPPVVAAAAGGLAAAMEPGLRGREDLPDDPAGDHGDLEAAMEPGLRGREDATPSRRGG